MNVPFVYLGLPVGCNARRLQTWEPVIKKIKAKLTLWKQKIVSFGGRICLIQSILTALPLFYFSFFKAPAGVVRTCTQLMRNFLWGGAENTHKIAWVKWTNVCKSKDSGGLGIKDLSLFNKALLGKWRWRFLTEPNLLWCRVIQAKIDRGGLRGTSPWWADINSACMDGDADWMKAGLHKSVRCGNATQFWSDNWLGNGSLEAQFPRLYNLSNQKFDPILKIGFWVDGAWHWSFKWRRPLCGRENLWLLDMLIELNSILLVEGCLDKWTWKLDPGGTYSVNSAYSLLQDQSDTGADTTFKFIWSAPAPSNTKAFMWRLLLDRIQTRENLQKRHVILNSAEAVCPFCAQHEETSSHLLFSCIVVQGVWVDCLTWAGLSINLSTGPRDHMLQVLDSGRRKEHKLGLLAVWMATVWSLWLTRNDVVFANGTLEKEKLLDVIKLRSWRWIREKLAGFRYSVTEWFASPQACLSSF